MQLAQFMINAVRHFLDELATQPHHRSAPGEDRDGSSRMTKDEAYVREARERSQRRRRRVQLTARKGRNRCQAPLVQIVFSEQGVPSIPRCPTGIPLLIFSRWTGSLTQSPSTAYNEA